MIIEEIDGEGEFTKEEVLPCTVKEVSTSEFDHFRMFKTDSTGLKKTTDEGYFGPMDEQLIPIRRGHIAIHAKDDQYHVMGVDGAIGWFVHEFIIMNKPEGTCQSRDLKGSPMVRTTLLARERNKLAPLSLICERSHGVVPLLTSGMICDGGHLESGFSVFNKRENWIF